MENDDVCGCSAVRLVDSSIWRPFILSRVRTWKHNKTIWNMWNNIEISHKHSLRMKSTVSSIHQQHFELFKSISVSTLVCNWKGCGHHSEPHTGQWISFSLHKNRITQPRQLCFGYWMRSGQRLPIGQGIIAFIRQSTHGIWHDRSLNIIGSSAIVIACLSRASLEWIDLITGHIFIRNRWQVSSKGKALLCFKWECHGNQDHS